MKLSGIVLQVSTVLTLILAGIFSIVLLQWTKPTLLFTINGPLKIFGSEFHPGDWLDYQMDYCKTTTVDAEEHYSWNDDVSYSTPGMAVRDLPQGCHTTLVRVLVPKIPPGHYKLEMIRVYQPTPLRRVEIRALSNMFTITASAPGRGNVDAP